jgi:hypothetical protein
MIHAVGVIALLTLATPAVRRFTSGNRLTHPTPLSHLQ